MEITLNTIQFLAPVVIAIYYFGLSARHLV
jgi:hypothetical protein